MAIEIRSTASFGRKVKPLVPCSRILLHVREPHECERGTSSAKFTFISRQVSPASLPVVSAGYCQRAVMDESGIIRTQMGTHNTSNGRSVWDALCDSTP
jgi:hypothetical protein